MFKTDVHFDYLNTCKICVVLTASYTQVYIFKSEFYTCLKFSFTNEPTVPVTLKVSPKICFVVNGGALFDLIIRFPISPVGILKLFAIGPLPYSKVCRVSLKSDPCMSCRMRTVADDKFVFIA